MIKQFLRNQRERTKTLYRKLRLKLHARNPDVKIVIGASNVYEAGWIPTEIEFLNLLKESDWRSYFRESTINAILAEHVWEHLNEEDGAIAAQYCFKYLKPGGYLRIAVPDGFHSDPEYIAYVRPGGHGPGSDDHKVLYNCNTLTRMLQQIGFKTKPLEWFDEQRMFHFQEWDPATGMIHRSKRFDERNQNGALKYTSLIIDAFKPAK
jgi:predicted SAM-dependent methyltransferase